MIAMLAYRNRSHAGPAPYYRRRTCRCSGDAELRPRPPWRDALWAITGLIGEHGADTLPLFLAGDPAQKARDEEGHLPPMLLGEEVIHDYRSLSLFA